MTHGQAFEAEQVYLVLVTTKARGVIRRIDSVYATFEGAKARVESMYLAPDELGQVQARALAR